MQEKNAFFFRLISKKIKIVCVYRIIVVPLQSLFAGVGYVAGTQICHGRWSSMFR